VDFGGGNDRGALQALVPFRFGLEPEDVVGITGGGALAAVRLGKQDLVVREQRVAGKIVSAEIPADVRQVIVIAWRAIIRVDDVSEYVQVRAARGQHPIAPIIPAEAPA